MPRAALIQNAFSYGAWSPRLKGRNDLDRYKHAVDELKNFIVLTQGGCTRRPASFYIGSSKNPAKKARLIRFIFSQDQAYQLEFGDGYIRFWVGDGQLLSAGLPYEIASPYLEADLPNIQFVQSADVMYLVDRKHAPQKLQRTAPVTWTIGAIAFTATPAEWTGTNYPGAIAFYQERLWLAGTAAQPQTLWASKSGAFENFTTGTADDDALKYTLASDTVNTILSLSPGKQLAIFTDSGEFTLGSATAGGPVTATSVIIVRESAYGSARIQPLRIESIALFVQRLNHKIREFAYVFEQDAYKSLDVTLLAEHLGYPTIVEIAYALDPVPSVWVVRSDGVLLSMSYDRDGQVYAWSEHPIGGGGLVESVSVIPGDDRDEVWLIVKRTIGGVTKRYVERLSEFFVSFTEEDAAHAHYLDCGLSYHGVPVTEVSGLDHLEGETVGIMGDGSVLPDQVVTAGKVVLTQDVTGVPITDGFHDVHVGYHYTSRLKMLPLDVSAADGTYQGRIKRIFGIIIRFFDTLGGFVGSMDENGEESFDELQFRRPDDLMDEPPPLFSGNFDVELDADYERDGVVIIEQRQALPMTILSVVHRVQFND